MVFRAENPCVGGSDKQKALQRYIDQAAYLHGTNHNSQKPVNDSMTLKQLSDMFLKYQFSKVKANAITAQHYNDQVSSLNKLMAFLGHGCRIKDISTLNLQNYKRQLEKQYSSSKHRLNLHISNLKTLFHWAKKNDILKEIPNIDAVNRSKIINKQRRIFTHEEINKLLTVSDDKMKAMIWLGLNCGFGCTDCSELQWKHLDFINGRVVFPRGKTGVPRDLPLWPETVEALRKIQKKGKLVFYTTKGNPFVRNVLKTDVNGNEKYCPINSIATKFSRILKKAGLDIPKGTGFYTLRGKQYIDTILDEIIPSDIYLAFVWTRPDFATIDTLPIYGPYGTKHIRRLISSGYEPSQTLIIDDNPDDSIFEYGNVIQVDPFRGDPDDCELLLLSCYLRLMNSSANICDIAKSTWKDTVLKLL